MDALGAKREDSDAGAVVEACGAKIEEAAGSAGVDVFAPKSEVVLEDVGVEVLGAKIEEVVVDGATEEAFGVKEDGADAGGRESFANGFTFSFSGSGWVSFAASCAGSFEAKGADEVAEEDEKGNVGDCAASFCGSAPKGLKDEAGLADVANSEELNVLELLL